MNQQIAVTSGNLSFDFLSYALVTSRAWKQISEVPLNVGLITNSETNSKLLDFLNSRIILRQIPELEGIHSGVQAKFSRLWLAQMEEFSNKIITIADLDMIPLSDTRNRLLEGCHSNQFIKWGVDHVSYSKPADIGKWPMDGSTSSGLVFQEVVNPKRLRLDQLVREWSTLPEIGRGNPYNEPMNFSDETLLREIWPKQTSFEVIEKERRVIEKSPMSGRIDRSKRLPLRNVKKLVSRGSFEFHGPRPFPYRSYFGRGILNYLDIPYQDYCDDMKIIYELLL